MQRIDLRPQIALAQGTISGMVLLAYESERPFQGALGDLDWKFSGLFSKLLKKQIITGKENEIVYVPIRWNEQKFSFLVLGAGSGKSTATDPHSLARKKELLKVAKEKIESLALQNMAIDPSDFGTDLKKEGGLWILN